MVGRKELQLNLIKILTVNRTGQLSESRLTQFPRCQAHKDFSSIKLELVHHSFILHIITPSIQGCFSSSSKKTALCISFRIP